VYQEVLKAVATSLRKFQGDSAKEFWGWCYRIARNKLNDQYRKQGSDRMQPMPPEDIWQMIEASSHDAPVTPAVRQDLQYALQLLTKSKPECYDFLWNHFVFELDYADIAADRNMTYDNVRMKIGRCLEEARSLVS
jgi:RNA polymerase sigma factor (sigma-70 family)